MKEEQRIIESCTIMLYKAALKGDTPSLLDLLDLDPHILDRCTIENSGRFCQSPIHIAADLGHLKFMTTLLEKNPCLAEELDYKRQSPLHLCASNGHKDMVRVLLDKTPNTCISRDEDGRNPLHVAAMNNGRINVLGLIIEKRPQAAYERTDAGESVLHLCVKYHRFEALRYLVKTVGTSIYADIFPVAYKYMQIFNGMSLVSSLSTILLTLSHIRFNQHFPVILMVFMWIVASAWTYTYLMAAFFVSHNAFKVNHIFFTWILHRTWRWTAVVFAIFLIFYFLDHVILLVSKVLKFLRVRKNN